LGPLESSGRNKEMLGRETLPLRKGLHIPKEWGINLRKNVEE